MHLLSCRGRNSELYRADGDYCTVPPRMCQSALGCSAERHFQRSLSQRLAQRARHGEPAPCQGTQPELGQPFCCCCWGHRDPGTDVLLNTAASTLSTWTAWSGGAAYRCAAHPSFSYSRASKMLAQRKEIPLHVFSLISSRNWYPFSYLKYSVAILLLLFH